MKKILVFSLSLLLLCSCESEAEKKARLQREEQARIELELQQKKEAEARAYKLRQDSIAEAERLEALRLEEKRRLEKERREKAIYDKYIQNSLRTGATPYARFYGRNRSCDGWGCSKISVKAPYNSDVIVTVKEDNDVVRHAYINGGDTYTLSLPNGSYQTFFYYGKGWNPNKVMKETNRGTIKGGFIEGEHFGKDRGVTLENNILTYELILQRNGNFSTSPSNAEEAF